MKLKLSFSIAILASFVIGMGLGQTPAPKAAPKAAPAPVKAAPGTVTLAPPGALPKNLARISHQSAQLAQRAPLYGGAV